LDKTNAVVLNLLSNHAFHTWKTIGDLQTTQVVDICRLRTGDESLLTQLEVGGKLRIQHCEVVITFIDDIEGQTVITFSPELSHVVGMLTAIEVKDFRFSKETALRALRFSKSATTAGESYYILGKIAHAQGKLKVAYDYYKKASDESHQLYLAHFGAAQILFEEGEHNVALDLFEKIMLNFPDDRDTQAYIALLRGVLNKEIIPFEKLNKIAPMFAYEYELWLSQGQLRLKRLSEHSVALKCLMNARALVEKNGVEIDVDLLSNISTLNYFLGKGGLALEQIKGIIGSFNSTATHTSSELLAHVEFENVFYYWSSFHGEIVQLDTNEFSFRVDDETTLFVGSELRLNGIVWKITQINDDNRFSAETLFGGTWTVGSNPIVEFKRSKNNFSDNLMNACFNFGRMLEEDGRIQAAMTLYEEILRAHPSFVDGKLILFQLWSQVISWSS
jgi:tetratricopeptide (TPR) repeat protein